MKAKVANSVEMNKSWGEKQLLAEEWRGAGVGVGEGEGDGVGELAPSERPANTSIAKITQAVENRVNGFPVAIFLQKNEKSIATGDGLCLWNC